MDWSRAVTKGMPTRGCYNMECVGHRERLDLGLARWKGYTDPLLPTVRHGGYFNSLVFCFVFQSISSGALMAI